MGTIDLIVNYEDAGSFVVRGTNAKYETLGNMLVTSNEAQKCLPTEIVIALYNLSI